MTVRIAAVQYLLRQIHDWSGFENQLRFVGKAAGDYKPQFVLLPEIFTTQILSFMDTRDLKSAVRSMSDYTQRYIELCKEIAAEWNFYFIAGSHPNLRDGKLYNTAYLITPGGEVFEQDKIHRTRWEREKWNSDPGNQLRLFETPHGKIAILICYDVEFPELCRVAASKGAQILFVPFNTDNRDGYLRVRHCAQARCIENQVYVAISGCVGNLPFVDNADVHYAQSGIYTPMDISFARDGIAAECTPNIETLVFHDVDLEVLRRNRVSGTVQNWNDRRRDIYKVIYRESSEGPDLEV